jgi:hypothetical protein
MQPMIYGYARVSTDGQSIDAQVRQMTQHQSSDDFEGFSLTIRPFDAAALGVEHLYHFQSNNPEWLEQILIDNTLYFSNPKNFDDPWAMHEGMVLVSNEASFGAYCVRRLW